MQIKGQSSSYYTRPLFQKHRVKPGLLRQSIAQVAKLKPPASLCHWHTFWANWAKVAALCWARCPGREEEVKDYAQNYAKNKKLDLYLQVFCTCWKSFEEWSGVSLCWETVELKSPGCQLWNFTLSILNTSSMNITSLVGQPSSGYT